jgi:formylglycine-generating enzyme required for sulfatase activity
MWFGCERGSNKGNRRRGNVWEWCRDRYEEGKNRVPRGSAWDSDGDFLHTASRFKGGPEVREDYIGFRLARDRSS